MVKKTGFIVSEGFVFIIPAAVVACVVAILGSTMIAAFFFALTAFLLWFFRNPERKVPEGEGLVIAPADGRILCIDEAYDKLLEPGRYMKVSIFMNLFSVHVNRMPCTGTIKAIRYRKGRFLAADRDKASEANEQNALLITDDRGRDIVTVQIAGLIARRIVCWVTEGMRLRRGERFGMIRFGSRLDVYLPGDTRISIQVGDRVKAGETALGVLP